MAHSVESSVQNAASRLRTSILALESNAVAPTAKNLEGFLLQLDGTAAEFGNLESQGLDLRAERVRWENLTSRLASRPHLIARPAAALPGGLEALRMQHGKSVDDAPWWGADVVQAKRRRRLGVEIVAILVGIPLLLGAAYWIFSTIFPPDPAAIAILDAEAVIDQAARDGDVASALPDVLANWEAYPDQAELAIWVSVLANEAGQGELAADASDAAEALLADNPETFWLLFSDHYARIGNAAASLDYAQRTLERNPDNAMAWYHRGRAAMMLGNRAEALVSLEQASTLAAESSPELAVNARVMYAEILRQPDFPIGAELTGTVPLTGTAPPTAPAP